MDPQSADRVIWREYEPKPVSVAQLRAFLRDELPPDHPQRDQVVWLASELATNAVLHARSPFRVQLTLAADRVRVAIEDDNPRLPAVTATDAQATSGRGLTIIDAVADRWGAGPRGRGKTIWFELMIEPPPPPQP